MKGKTTPLVLWLQELTHWNWRRSSSTDRLWSPARNGPHHGGAQFPIVKGMTKFPKTDISVFILLVIPYFILVNPTKFPTQALPCSHWKVTVLLQGHCVPAWLRTYTLGLFRAGDVSLAWFPLVTYGQYIPGRPSYCQFSCWEAQLRIELLRSMCQPTAELQDWVPRFLSRLLHCNHERQIFNKL